MARTVYDRILRRELGYTGGHNNRYSKVRGIYGDQTWVEDLDIVNELDGHSGCVNALSWSRSGRLLASGSDDQHINLHAYLPDSSTSQFQFTTTIATGHRANIFSVKFMPNSNDRTIVSAAGDREVRIFDIEYAGQSATSGTASDFRPSRATADNTFNGVRYLSEGDTNAKVFRSHSDRVKRIVTESSPYFFLTCSEDGEVRQWDTRQPSSAYPAPRDRITSRRLSAANEDVPPALISYKRYNLDLNTISCSPSQPHYIALGGAHVHCFLHDRRMLGRDKLIERGVPSSSSSSHRDEELRDQATYCVKKFAPNGKRTMRRNDSGHITACKISDANPNELIVSWSGDWIYNFDINRTPDAKETVQYTSVDNGTSTRSKMSVLRKRKRTKVDGSTSNVDEDEARASSRARTESVGPEEEEMALMVQYENGQSEEIPIESRQSRTHANETLSEAERLSYRIAKSTVKVRKHMFTLGSAKPTTNSDSTGHRSSFTSVLGLCGSALPQLDDVMRAWRYPVDPTEEELQFQNQLRLHRGSARRLMQASGTLARALGGKLQMSGMSDAIVAKYFSVISPAPNERRQIRQHEQFGYDFLKAILLWLDSGIGALIDGFSPSAELSASSPRCPIPPDSTTEAIDEYLIPYLLRLASTDPIMNVDASWLSSDENRTTFVSEKAAVIAFAQALKIPFADLSSAVVPASPDGSSSSTHVSAQDRRTALRFWAFKVGRGVLMNAAKGVDFEMVDNAFGGLGRGDASIAEEESALAEKFRVRLEDDDDPVVQRARLARRGSLGRAAQQTGQNQDRTSSGPSTRSTRVTVEDEEDDDDEERNERVLPLQELQNAARELLDRDSEGSEEDSEEEEDSVDDTSDDEPEDDEDDEITQRIFWRSGYSRGMSKEKVEAKLPCGTHTRIFKGHCNVKTVKDVNFYGLEDEYVVSGSDSGHLFIWDKKTGKLLNILEGDGEVVNVVQGHPYEPVLAVSGIDHTIKIFSSDARSRHDARNGIGVSAIDTSDFSSIFSMRMRRRRAEQAASTESPTRTPPPDNQSGDESDDEVRVAPNGLHSRKRIQDEYQITSENDSQRRGGNADAFVTQGMLMQLAAHLRERQAAGHADSDLPIIVPGAGEDGDCQVM